MIDYINDGWSTCFYIDMVAIMVYDIDLFKETPLTLGDVFYSFVRTTDTIQSESGVTRKLNNQQTRELSLSNT